MRTIGIWSLAFCFMAPALAAAADQEKRAVEPLVIVRAGEAASGETLRAAIVRETDRLARSLQTASAGRDRKFSSDRGWIGRHPVLFSAIVGAGAGVVAGLTMQNELFCSGGDEDCLIYGNTRIAAGAGLGAGLGAVVGLVIGAARE